MLNLNEADKYREFGATIPDGEFVWLKPIIKNGNTSLPGFSPEDNGIFTASKPPSDFVYAAIEFVVTRGPFAGSKIFENFGFAGGSSDDKGQSKALNITKMRLRGILESAFGINPDDTGPQASQMRQLRSIKSLEQLEFIARVGVEEGGKNEQTGIQYPDRNMIGKIILVTDPEYAPMRQGIAVAAKPAGKRPSRSGGTPVQGAAAGNSGGAMWQVEASQHANAAQQPIPQPQPIPQYQPPQPQPQPMPQQMPQYQQPQQMQQPQPQYQPVAAIPPQPPQPNWQSPQPQQMQQPQPMPQQQPQPQPANANGGWAAPLPTATPAEAWTGAAPPAGGTGEAPSWLNNPSG